MLNPRAAFAALIFIVLVHSSASAQTTAGASATIVVPVTAQTASFASEVTVFNPNGAAVTVVVAFYEANNVVPPAVPGPKTCTDVAVPAGKSVQFNLAGQCALGAGSHFGLLVLSELAGTKPIHGFARVQNPQGIGFSVEGFPAENFNNQVSHANGLKKTTSGMIYQTNCFAGSLASGVTYTLKLFDGTSGSQIGTTISGTLAAFQQIRYLDVFGPNGVNVANADQMNVRAEFASTNNALLVGFCTVQDNASFGADFRIAKSYGTTAGFVQGGNSFGTTAVLGTNDNQALDIRVNGGRVMRYEPQIGAPNVIGGSPGNSVPFGTSGNTIGGGGSDYWMCFEGYVSAINSVVEGSFGTVSGGYCNTAGGYATIGGGAQNQSYIASTVSGGAANYAEKYSTVGGGAGNTATGEFSTIGGGNYNYAEGQDSTVTGGSGNSASGIHSTVAGGRENNASGNYSFASGSRAKALHHHSFVWGGSETIDTNSTAAGDFVVYAPTAVRMFVGATGSSGCTLTSGASGWSCASDRRLKSDIEAVDGAAVLNQVLALPVARWTFSSVPGIAHMGPMAQDFHAAFNLGDDATRLAPMDVQGVALAAIQGLNAKLEAKVAAQARRIADLEERVSQTELVQADMVAMKATLAELQRERATVAAR